MPVLLEKPGAVRERTGALHFVTLRTSSVPAPIAIRARMVEFQRADYSMPPLFGSRIAALVLSDPELLAMWKVDLVFWLL